MHMCGYEPYLNSLHKHSLNKVDWIWEFWSNPHRDIPFMYVLTYFSSFRQSYLAPKQEMLPCTHVTETTYRSDIIDTICDPLIVIQVV